MQEGYKQTEIGIIPKDWDCIAAKHLMKIETGSRNTEHKTDMGKYPFFVRSQKVEHIDTYHYDCEAVLTAGDGVGTGKVFHHYIGKFDAHQRVYVMSNFDGITGRYFYNYFSENFGKEVSKYTAKSSVDSVRRDMIAEMIIPLPPIEEQDHIAKALSDVDSMIFSLEKLIAKKKAVKQGAMQELLTGKKRLPEFTGEWSNKKLSECTERIIVGLATSITQYYREQGTVIFRNLNILPNKLDDSDILFLDSDFANSCPNKKIRTDDVLTVHTGYVGISCLVPEKYDGTLTFTTLITTTKKQILSPRYLMIHLNSELGSKMIEGLQAGGGRNNLNVSDFEQYEICFPKDTKEQEAIASILSDMDNEIEALELKLDKTRQIKQGMMQQLLTGKIRLT